MASSVPQNSPQSGSRWPGVCRRPRRARASLSQSLDAHRWLCTEMWPPWVCRGRSRGPEKPHPPGDRKGNYRNSSPGAGTEAQVPGGAAPSQTLPSSAPHPASRLAGPGVTRGLQGHQWAVSDSSRPAKLGYPDAASFASQPPCSPEIGRADIWDLPTSRTFFLHPPKNGCHLRVEDASFRGVSIPGVP